MEQNRFDRLSTQVATTLTRRRGLAAVMILGLALVNRSDESEAGKKRKKKRKKKGSGGGCPSGTRLCKGMCVANLACCADSECPENTICRNGVCGCVPDGESLDNCAARPNTCCSGMCIADVCGI